MRSVLLSVVIVLGSASCCEILACAEYIFLNQASPYSMQYCPINGSGGSGGGGIATDCAANTVVSDSNWLRLTQSGTGFTYTADPNPTRAFRVATISRDGATDPGPNSRVFLMQRPAGSRKGDIRGWGETGLITRNPLTGENYTYPFGGSPVMPAQRVMPSAGPDWDLVAIGDFNADLKNDLVWQNRITGQFDIWTMNIDVILDRRQYVFPPGWALVATGDVNRDGKTDIFFRNAQTGANLVWFMDGVNVTSGSAMTNVDPTWQLGLTGDFNGDGGMDLIWTNQTRQLLDIWILDGVSLVNHHFYDLFPSDWSLVTSGDENGDGNDEVLYRNLVTGTNLLWTLSGSTVWIGEYFPSQGPEWVLVGSGDFDGDASLDIIWRNPATGDVKTVEDNGILPRGPLTLAWGSGTGFVPVSPRP